MAADWLSTPSVQIPGTPLMFSPALQALVSGAGNDPEPAVRPGRGYVVAADLRAANITAIVGRINAAATEKHDAALMLHKFVTGPATSPTEINMTNLETLLQAVADNRAAGTQENVLFSRMVYAQAGLQRPVV